MPKLLFIAVHRPFRSPSQRFRFDQYMDFFKARGYDITYSSLISEKDDLWFYNPGHFVKKLCLMAKSVFMRFKDLYQAADYDVVFVQREAIMLGSSFFERQFAKKSKLIFDFDDSIWLRDVSAANKRFGWLKKPEKINEIIASSDMVFAGNDYLAAYARKFSENVMVVPTVLKLDQTDFKYSKKVANQKRILGWIGSTTTIKHIEWALPVLEQLFALKGAEIELIVMSDKQPALPTIDYTFRKWTQASEIALLKSMDIGFMPLPDDEWTRGKCGFKGLQCMSYGIPVVMSAVGANNQIISHGVNGFLASSISDWIECLTRLIDDAQLCNTLGERGRKTVADSYALDQWQPKVVHILDQMCSK